MRRAGTLLAASVTGAAMLMSVVGCAGTAPRSSVPESSDSASASAQASASGSPGAEPSAEPSKGAVTAEGTDVEIGGTATVDWSPRDGVEGKLALTVTKLESTSFKQTFKGWKLDDATLSRAPYFVRVTVKNLGDTDLGGYSVPLWGLDGEGNLVEAASFKEPFTTCDGKTLPKPFAAGATTKACLVMLVPGQGTLDGVSYRPYEEFDPITWEGDPTPYTTPKASKAPSGDPTPRS